MPGGNYTQPTRGLVSQNDRAIIERATVPRSKFIGQWSRKTAFDAGYLVPFLVDEILPGDKMNYTLTAYVRMSTPLFPMFDSQRIDTFFFFVPNRLVWDNWARFMGEYEDADLPTLYQIPQMDMGEFGFQIGSVADHFGLPVLIPQVGVPNAISALPFRMYNLIYNEWFRDQNVTFKALQWKVDTTDNMANYPLQRRAKSHDYFTSALPFLQKFTAPTMGLTGMLPVVGLGDIGATNAGPLAVATTPGVANPLGTDSYAFWVTGSDLRIRTGGVANTQPQIYADLADATGISVNDMRSAFMIQSMLERDARGGTRYVEQIRAHFGVINPDFRLQRPEYIGGGQSSLQITPVAQTAPSAGVPVGALGAAATAAGQHRASYAATEHGFIMGLINVRSELSYQQGIHKQWSRNVRIHYYTPELALLGEQAIDRREIFATGDIVTDTIVFGYQERWHEYRTRYSEVTGIFRSGVAGTMDAWHLAQYFATAPTLSTAFIEDNPDMARVLAAGALAEGQQYLADLLIERVAVRPLPMFGTPATLGRF